MKNTVSFLIILLLFTACKNGKKGRTLEIELHRYSEYEEVKSDTLLMEENVLYLDPRNWEEGVYYVMTSDASAPNELQDGFPIYLNSEGAVIEIADGWVLIGGNEENDAFQKLKTDLDRAADMPDKQMLIWDDYLQEHLSHPMGEEVFLSVFDPMSQIEEYTQFISRFLQYAEESFLSRPEVVEISSFLESEEENQ